MKLKRKYDSLQANQELSLFKKEDIELIKFISSDKYKPNGGILTIIINES